MDGVVLLILVAIGAAGLAGGLAWWLGRKASRSALDAARASLHKTESDLSAERAAHETAKADLVRHRDALKSAHGDAARLPDALNRAERAEKDATDVRLAKDALLAEKSRQDGELNAAREEVARLEKQVETADTAKEGLRKQLVTAQTEASSQAAQLKSSIADVERLQGLNEQQAKAIEELRASVMKLSAANSSLDAQLSATRDRLKESEAFLDNAQKQLRSAFLEAASKVFDEKSLSLEQRIQTSGEASRASLDATMKPFSEQLGRFHDRIEKLSTDHATDFAKFQGSVGHLQQLNQQMADATNALTRALKGNAKARGDWGEAILESVLQLAGLVEGMHYERQSSVTDEDTGGRLVPDIIVKLPNDHRVAVDSKVNLIAWAEACNADSPEAYQEAIGRHAVALRTHVRDLASKNYPKAIGTKALDVTVLFVAIEGALSSALAAMPELQHEAMRHRIAFASPNTLMAMLCVIERLWQRDKLQRQVSLIADEGGKLLESLNIFLPEFDAIQKHLAKADEAFKDARRRFYDSDQSVISRAQRLVQAGVRPRKGKALLEALEPAQEALPALPASVDGEAADGSGVAQ